MDMEDYATVRRIKLEQCVQLATFKTDANQVSECEEEFGKLNFSVTTELNSSPNRKYTRLTKSTLGDAMDSGHRGNADRELHDPRVSSGGGAAQEGARAVPSGH